MTTVQCNGRADGVAVSAGWIPVVGCHGGAGVTTLCRDLGSWTVDSGTSAPAYSGDPYLLVTRGTAAGALAAMAAVRELTATTSMSMRIHLAVVGDGLGPMPVSARARLRALRAEVQSVTAIPYVHRWRYVPADVLQPRLYRRAVHRLGATVAPGSLSREEDHVR